VKPIRMLQHLVRDESSAEVLEYAMVAGLIVLLAISVIGRVGVKMTARWASLNNSL
jgi:Flp pilus assembly pilin Flp